jgi:hypothetical protein
MKLVIMHFSPASSYSYPFVSSVLLSMLLSITLSLCSPLNVRDQVSRQ